MIRQSRNTEVNCRGQRRSSVIHLSTTDPDARLYKKSPDAGAILCFVGHVLMENQSGLIVHGDLTQAEGHAERRAACVTPHVAQRLRPSAVDDRTTRHKIYALPLRHRKPIEAAFGWVKTVGGMTQTLIAALIGCVRASS